jgi:hypothetical protein
MRQSSPSAGELNTLTVSLQSFGTLPATSAITIRGLLDTLTNTSVISLAVNRTVLPSPLSAEGSWNQSTGSLTVNLTSHLPGQKIIVFAFTVRNSKLGQDGVEASLEVAGLILRTKMDGTLLVADFLQRDIGQVCQH